MCQVGEAGRLDAVIDPGAATLCRDRVDGQAWGAELKLHDELFGKLAGRLPPELELRLGAMHQKLADEFLAAYNREGAAVTKRENVHRMADANKAFAHFAW